MDDMQAFERRVAAEVNRVMGPSEPVDDVGIFDRITATRHVTSRFRSMFGGARFVVAAVIVAVFGGFLIVSVVPRHESEQQPAAGAASPAPSVVEAAPTRLPEGPIVMGPGESAPIGGYREVGRVGDGASGLETTAGAAGPVVMGDRLVAVATGRRGDVIVSTTDGQTWVRSTLPGSTLSTVINDLAVTSEGLLAVGRDGVRGDWQARLWASQDGEVWTSLEPPTDIILNRILSTADPLAVTSFDWLWIMGSDGEWVRGTRLLDSDIRAGPGGFLWWDIRNTSEGPTGRRSFLMHSTDLVEWDDVDLSRSPGLAEAVNAGVIAHATEAEWILVSSPSVFTSPDGLEWQEWPRPPGMDWPWWISDVGDEVHAFESRGDGTRVLWTWQRGERVGPPEQASGVENVGLFKPVEWQGEWVTLAAGDDARFALWRYASDDGGG